jgi:cytochrome c oxidase cbb3-type subunit III
MSPRFALRVVAAACLLLGLPAHAQTLAEGEALFKSRCAVCHGQQADGRSDLARLMRPPPANLRASQLDALQSATIVRKGGEAVGRSANMPVWEAELNEHELQSVLAYLGSIKGVTP